MHRILVLLRVLAPVHLLLRGGACCLFHRRALLRVCSHNGHACEVFQVKENRPSLEPKNVGPASSPSVEGSQSIVISVLSNVWPLP